MTGAEVCDDGNLIDGDGCDSNCTVTACGNGITTARRGLRRRGRIDDLRRRLHTAWSAATALPTRWRARSATPAARRGTCDADCTLATCGDGTTNTLAGEQCDSGSGQTAGCDLDCTFATCGDGTHNSAAGEACDDGNTTNGDGCDNNCTATACGNGVRTGVEECDDHNLTAATAVTPTAR